MKKIISLFQRNYDGNRQVRDEVVPGAEWVISGEGKATRKFDGTCCMIRDGKLFRRYEASEDRQPPSGFILEERKEQKDIKGRDVIKLYGWVPVGEGPADQYHREAFVPGLLDGTYELCGPKVQGNPEHFNSHVLVPHRAEVIETPRTFEELKTWLANKDIEGIVWHHPDGRMVKIKKKDFGFKRIDGREGSPT